MTISGLRPEQRKGDRREYPGDKGVCENGYARQARGRDIRISKCAGLIQ